MQMWRRDENSDDDTIWILAMYEKLLFVQYMYVVRVTLFTVY
jgi:hypothetical protein